MDKKFLEAYKKARMERAARQDFSATVDRIKSDVTVANQPQVAPIEQPSTPTPALVGNASELPAVPQPPAEPAPAALPPMGQQPGNDTGSVQLPQQPVADTGIPQPIAPETAAIPIEPAPVPVSPTEPSPVVPLPAPQPPAEPTVQWPHRTVYAPEPLPAEQPVVPPPATTKPTAPVYPPVPQPAVAVEEPAIYRTETPELQAESPTSPLPEAPVITEPPASTTLAPIPPPAPPISQPISANDNGSAGSPDVPTIEPIKPITQPTVAVTDPTAVSPRPPTEPLRGINKIMYELPKETAAAESSGIAKTLLYLAGVFLCGLLVIGLFLFILFKNPSLFHQAQNHAGQSPNPSSQAKDQALANQYIAELSKLVAVPTNETPTVATITDVDKLRQTQPFFNKAQNGDILIIYSTKAYLYDPVKNVVIDSAPVKITNNNQIETETTESATPATASATPR